MLGAVACGKATDSSHLQSETSGMPRKLVFVKDELPVDGALTEITVQQSSDGKYTVTRKSTIISRSTGRPNTKADVLGSGLTCEASSSGTGYLCSIDERILDGALLEIGFFRQEDGTWYAMQHKVITDMRTGKTGDETKFIIQGLSKR